MIPVTKTFLPPIEEYTTILQHAWDKKWITNRGELVKLLEEKLRVLLDLQHITLTCNGTIPLQIALKAMDITGEVITTPFSYVATSSSIAWEDCQPVFVDIDPLHFTIDEHRIEAAITPKTTAILATHVFGNPCAVDAIQAIAQKHNLRVIYDGAHAFGVQYKGKSLLNFGDITTCSFHATKLFHTAEGGAMITNDEALHQKLFYHHNFGHKGPLAFQGIGINGKMSELSAAMGLAVLPYLPYILGSRKERVNCYQDLLANSGLRFMTLREGTEWNSGYFPVVFSSETHLNQVVDALHAQNIVPRRYFYPSLNGLPYVSYVPMPESEKLAACVLCLPLYDDLAFDDIAKICNIITSI